MSIFEKSTPHEAAAAAIGMPTHWSRYKGIRADILPADHNTDNVYGGNVTLLPRQAIVVSPPVPHFEPKEASIPCFYDWAAEGSSSGLTEQPTLPSGGHEVEFPGSVDTRTVQNVHKHLTQRS